ncbi:hypothetical protein ACOMCU_00295 [Lysinibacillus sp. UGB7]|uniref:hypothetical protein n=1 Tax=Lysinibacillus sp. UGB7 TaxID=3411039 RepID=UPI003B825013
MKKLLAITSLTLLLSACNPTETAIIENVKLVDTDPFENCKTCSYGVFEKENGEQFKLPISDEKIKQMVENTLYDIEYENKSFDYPDYEVVNISIK